MLQHRDRRHDAAQEAKSCRQKAIKTIAVYESMT